MAGPCSKPGAVSVVPTHALVAARCCCGSRHQMTLENCIGHLENSVGGFDVSPATSAGWINDDASVDANPGSATLGHLSWERLP